MSDSGDTPFAKAPRTSALASLPTDDKGDPVEVVDGWVELHDVALVGRTLALPEAEVIEFANCSLRSCRLITAPDAIVRARRTSFANCDLSQVPFKTVTACRFGSCKMTGLSVLGELSDCELIDCRLQLGSLAMSAIERTSFADCELIDVDLLESKLSDVTFAGSRLVEVGVHRATFDRVDLRDATIDSINNVSSLTGCMVDNHQLYALAPLLANIVGLSVSE